MTENRFEPGVLIGDKFRLEEKLGEGGIAAVWAATEMRVDRRVAIKFLKGTPNDEEQKRFVLEAQALGRLNHPNCITLYDFGFSDEVGAQYLAMEYLEGESLADWRGQIVPLRDVLEVGRQVALALGTASDEGIVHRDLKPENIFLVEAYDREMVVKVLDFGLARMATQDDDVRLTRLGEIFGTPAYMSPEQIRGARDAGHRSDLYSLGVILYELVDDRFPFAATSNYDLMSAHLNEPPPPLERFGVPEALDDVIFKLLEKEPEDRFDDAHQLYRALDAIDVDALPDEDSTVFVHIDPGTSQMKSRRLHSTMRADTDAAEPLVQHGDLADVPTEKHVETVPAETRAPVRDTTPPTDAAPHVSERPRYEVWLMVAVGLVLAIGVIALGLTTSGSGTSAADEGATKPGTETAHTQNPAPRTSEGDDVPAGTDVPDRMIDAGRAAMTNGRETDAGRDTGLAPHVDDEPVDESATDERQPEEPTQNLPQRPPEPTKDGDDPVKTLDSKLKRLGLDQK